MSIMTALLWCEWHLPKTCIARTGLIKTCVVQPNASLSPMWDNVAAVQGNRYKKKNKIQIIYLPCSLTLWCQRERERDGAGRSEGGGGGVLWFYYNSKFIFHMCTSFDSDIGPKMCLNLSLYDPFHCVSHSPCIQPPVILMIWKHSILPSPHISFNV